MKQISGKELTKILARHGWTLLHVHGSHHVYGRSDSVVRLSIPVHGNKPLKAGLAKHLLKMAGLGDEHL